MNGMASTLTLDDMEDVAAFFESNGSNSISDNVAAK
jgi:cytochrome c553